MKQIIYFFILAIILSSCSDKPPMACNDTEIFSIINKNQISQISITNNEKINTLIEKNNDALLTKTTLLVNDIIPKNQ